MPHLPAPLGMVGKPEGWPIVPQLERWRPLLLTVAGVHELQEALPVVQWSWR